MNCLKHGYDWPHDKTCPYCDVERLTVLVESCSARNESDADQIIVDAGIIKAHFGRIKELETALRQIHNTAEFPSDEAHQDCVDIAKEALN